MFTAVTTKVYISPEPAESSQSISDLLACHSHKTWYY